MKCSVRLLACVFVGWLTTACHEVPVVRAASDPAQPQNVLFVGNSFTYYNNSLHNHYRRFVRAARGPKWQGKARSILISGGHLDEHREGLRQRLVEQSFDAVVLQGHSLEPLIEFERFQCAVTEYAAWIRQQGAQPVLFMTWAYSSRPGMTERLERAYYQVGKQLDAMVVPVGSAFARVTAERPDLVLRMPDKRHPTLAGTYLAACTMFGALHGQSPVGLAYTADLPEIDAFYLQRAAWQTLQASPDRSR
ncbi:MAG: hypothetical protein ACI8UD_004239 [Planctomycetota bacterium]|jgi:hypothetical protein